MRFGCLPTEGALPSPQFGIDVLSGLFAEGLAESEGELDDGATGFAIIFIGRNSTIRM